MNPSGKSQPLHFNSKTVSFPDIGGLSPDLRSSPFIHTAHNLGAFSTADKSFNSRSSLELYSPNKTISEFNKEPLKLKVLEVTPRASHLNLQEQQDIEEFEDSPISAHLTKRHLSDKSHSPGIHKKSMSDIAARIERNKTMNFTSTLTTQMNEVRAEDEMDLSGSFSRALYDDNNHQSRLFDRIQSRSRTNLHPSLDFRSFQEKKTFTNFGRVTYQVERKKLSLDDMVILENVLQFLDFDDAWKMSKICFNFRNLKVYKKLFAKVLNSHFTKGLNSQHQIVFWNHLLNFRKLKHDHPFTFSQHFVKRCVYIEQIKKDLDRTLPEYEKFSSEQG